MSTDIHDKIRSEVERRLGIARDAAEGDTGEWYVGRKWNVAIAAPVDFNMAEPLAAYGVAIPFSEHIALHDPADAIRRYGYALKVLDRHTPAADEPHLCRWCFNSGDEQDYFPWPCPEVTDLAESLGIDTGGTDA